MENLKNQKQTKDVIADALFVLSQDVRSFGGRPSINEAFIIIKHLYETMRMLSDWSEEK